MQPLSRDLDQNIKKLYSTFPISKSFDFLTRNLFLGETKAFWIGINGMCKMDVLQQIFSDLQNPQYMTDNKVENILNYMNARLGYAQASLCDNWEALTHKLLSGPTVLFIDDFDQAIIIDVRNYPSRSVEEPDTEKVTLGARDGFVESMLSNTNLIRRRIRSPKLTFETMTLGEESQTDIVIGYLESSADPKLLWKLKKTLQNLTVTSLTMGAKSLEELLMPKRWFHPLPCMHYTERPDVACSFLTEGHIVLIVDTSPSVLVLPCTIFQFTQSPEDYYKSPIVGTYFRLIRYLCIPISLLICLFFAVDRIFSTAFGKVGSFIHRFPANTHHYLLCLCCRASLRSSKVLYSSKLLPVFRLSFHHRRSYYRGYGSRIKLGQHGDFVLCFRHHAGQSVPCQY